MVEHRSTNKQVRNQREIIFIPTLIKWGQNGDRNLKLEHTSAVYS